jgi:hypothetical protein
LTVQEIIDQALEGDNVPPASADYTLRRRKALAFLRELLDEVWWMRDWPRRRRTGTVTVGAGDAFAAVPADFQSLGPGGGLWHPTSGAVLAEVAESVIFDRRSGGSTTDAPDVFAIFDVDPATYRPRLQFPPNTAELTFTIRYQALPPRILDPGDPNSGIEPGDEEDMAIGAIGAEYHQSVLAPGLAARLREQKGDSRWQYLNGRFETGKAGMLKEEARAQSDRVRQMPSFFGRG